MRMFTSRECGLIGLPLFSALFCGLKHVPQSSRPGVREMQCVTSSIRLVSTPF